MKRACAFMVFLVASCAAFGQNLGALSGFCDQGGRHAITSGLGSTNFLQGVIPSCTVTVYLSGTQTLAPIFTNSTGSPLANPFTANAVGSAAPGQWTLWADPTKPIDVVLSGGIPPNVYSTPVTKPDQSPSSAGAFVPLAGGTMYGTLFAPDINGEVYPAACQRSPAPSWCSGTSASDYVKAACSTLPAGGGIINQLGLIGNLDKAITGCMSPTKQVIFLEDPTNPLLLTEADGGITYPLDNGSMFLGPGAGQCAGGNNPIIGGIHLVSPANVTAIVGPAHTDGSQESFTASGLCLWGNVGTTVSKGLIYAKSVFVNTTISNNQLSVCNNSCIWLENDGGIIEVSGNEANGTSGVYSINTSPIVVASSGGPGCEAQSINIHGGNAEHANGVGQHEINVFGNGAGAQACGLYVHDVYVEKNIQGTPSTSAISIQDCFSCSFSNIEGGGGNSTSGDMVNLSGSAGNRVQNVSFYNISNVFNSWTNTINDTTTQGTVIPLATYPFVTSYISNPGYQQAPVLPGSTLQAVGTDVMGGDGAFSTGSGTFGTNFHDTGCLGTVTCTYSRTNVSPPPGYTFSEQVQITGNTDPSSGYNGVEYVPLTSFIAGQQYVASFWAKGDGTFAGFPTFQLWNSSTATFFCFGTSPQPFPAAWTLYSFGCTPSSSGSAHLAITSRTPIGSTPGSTGTVNLGGFIFSPVQALTPGSLLYSVSPYGIGSAILTTLGASGPATFSNGTLNIPQYSGGSGGVPTVNGNAGPLVMDFSAGAGSCVFVAGTTTCTSTGSGTGGGSVTNFIAGTWPTWLTPSVATSTTTPTLAVAASAIPNSALANPGLTLGSTALTLGATTSTIAGLTLSSPTLTTPNLGTPSAVNLANATNLPWTAITGTPSTSQVPFQSLTTSGTSGPATLVSGVLNVPQYTGGTGGGGTVASCSLANQLTAYLTAGSTVNCQPGLFAGTPTMTSAQLTTLFTSVASAGGNVIIPAGTAQIGFNPSTALGGQDWRQGAAMIQLGALGIARDARQWNLTITSGSNQVNVGADFGAEAIGKSFWVSSGGNFGSTQQTWLATITAYTFPNATLSANAPFSYTGNVWVGTDNTTRFQAALNSIGAIPLLIPTGGAIMTQTLLLNNSQSIIGMGSGNGQSVVVGAPGQDIFQAPDTSIGGSDSGAGMRIEHLHLIVDSGVNWAWGYTAYNANAVPTTIPPVYRPLYEKTAKVNNPCGRGWAQNCFDGIASTTQNSGAICVLTSPGPTVSNQIVFPDLPAAFVATVSSTGGSCGSGGTTYNISPSFPNTSGYTVAQAHWYSTTSVQTSTTAITGTYPQTIHLANPIAPQPGFESNVAPSGRIKDSAGNSFMYYGESYSANTITLTAGPACSGADCSTGFAIVPRNPCTADFNTPSPYTPTLNSGDSTPSGANFFAGDCAGAAGIAYPTANGNVFVGTGPSQARIVDVDVAPSLSQLNHGSTGFYFGGNKTGYHTLWDGLRTEYTEFSFVQGPASYGQHGVAAVGPTSNGNQLTNCEFYSAKAIALVSWQGSPISQCDFYSTELNPYDGTTNGAAAGFYMSPTYDEQTGGIVTSVTSTPVTGVTGEPENGSHAAIPPFSEVDCFGCTFTQNNFEGGYNAVGGSGNRFTATQLGLPVADYGSRNVFDGQAALSGRIGLAWGAQWLNWGNEESCDGFSSGGTGALTNCGAGDAQPFQGKSMESDNRGVTANPSPNDLAAQIKPAQWNNNGAFDASPMTTINNVDATETYWGRNATCTLGGAAQCSVEHFPTDYIQIAPFNPIAPTPYISVAEFKSSNGSLNSFNLKIGAFDQGDGLCASSGQFYSTTVTVGTSWTPWADRVDFSAHSGCVLQIQLGAGNASGVLSVGYFNFLQASKVVHAPTGSLTAGAACPAGSVSGDILSDDGTSIYWCGPGKTVVASGTGGGPTGPFAPGVTPEFFGAHGDAFQMVNGCNTTASSTTVVCPSASFVSGDAGSGKEIWIAGAGVGGGPLGSVIATVVNGTTITVSPAAATASVTNAYSIVGHDDVNAIQTCWNYSAANRVPCYMDSPTGYLEANGNSGNGLLMAVTPVTFNGAMNVQGSSQTKGNTIYCEINGDCVSLQAGPVQGATMANLAILVDQSYPNSRGIHLNATPAPGSPANSGGLFNSTLDHIQVESPAQECLWMDGGGGVGYAFNLPNQFINLYNFICNGPDQMHTANLVLLTGQDAQVNFLGGAVNGNDTTSLSNYPNPLISIHEKTGGLNDAPMAIDMHGFTYEVGEQGLYISQSTDIHYDNGYVERVGTGLIVANTSGFTFNGNHLANVGFVTAAATFDVNTDGSFRDNVLFGNSPFVPLAMAVCTNNTGYVDFAENSATTTSTTGCATLQRTPAATFNVAGTTVFVNASATPITTINAPNVMPGKTLTLYAGGTFTLGSGGNINFGGIAAPLTVTAGTSVTLQLFDLGPTWLITATTASGVVAGVSSFNSRTGAVTPTTGDYTVSQVAGAAPLASPTFTGKSQFPSSTTTNAPENLGSGTAPTSPVDGDVWITSTGMFAQIAGSTIGPFASTGVVAGVSSFNTRTGAVVPASGDYTISQITGGAPLASPTFTGTPAAPTAAFGANTTQVATMAALQASVPANSETVASSTTPTFSVSKLASFMVLTGSVTTFTLASGSDGQLKTICWGQGAGGFTVAPPANVHGFAPVGVTASLFSCQDFVYNAANTIWLARSPGVINE